MLLFPIAMPEQTLCRYSRSLEKRWSSSPIVIPKRILQIARKSTGEIALIFVQSEFIQPTEVLVLSLVTDSWYTGNNSKPLQSLLGQLVLVLLLHLRPVFCSSLVFISYKVERSNAQVWDLSMGKRKGFLQQLWDRKAASCQPPKS